MNADIHEPRPFDCPDCGHHHKADLHGMVGHPEIHGKVPCAKCGKTLWLSLSEAGDAQVELYEEHLHEAVHRERIVAHKAKVAAEAAAAERAAVQATAGAGGGGSSVIVSVIAAGIVAVVVSLVMGASKDGAGDDGQEDARIDAMAQEIADLKGMAAAASADASEVGRKLGELEKRLNDRMVAIAEAAKGDPAAMKAARETSAALGEAVEAVKASYKSLHGRIERNHTALFQLDKRVKKLESP